MEGGRHRRRHAACGTYVTTLSIVFARLGSRDVLIQLTFMVSSFSPRRAAQVGEVFVEFGESDGAHKAALALRNRQFSGRTVTCAFHDEGQYAEGVLA